MDQEIFRESNVTTLNECANRCREKNSRMFTYGTYGMNNEKNGMLCYCVNKCTKIPNTDGKKYPFYKYDPGND